MLYHGQIVSDGMTNLVIGTFFLSLILNSDNRRLAYAIGVSLIAAKIVAYYGVMPLQLLVLAGCALIPIRSRGKWIEVETNEVNYLLSATFMVRVAVWTLYLIGLYGDETFYVSSILLILFELIVILGSARNGTNLHRFTGTSWDILNRNLYYNRLARSTGQSKIMGVG